MNKINSNLNKYFLFIILKILSIILLLYGLLEMIIDLNNIIIKVE